MNVRKILGEWMNERLILGEWMNERIILDQKLESSVFFNWFLRYVDFLLRHSLAIFLKFYFWNPNNVHVLEFGIIVQIIQFTFVITIWATVQDKIKHTAMFKATLNSRLICCTHFHTIALEQSVNTFSFFSLQRVQFRLSSRVCLTSILGQILKCVEGNGEFF